MTVTEQLLQDAATILELITAGQGGAAARPNHCILFGFASASTQAWVVPQDCFLCAVVTGAQSGCIARDNGRTYLGLQGTTQIHPASLIAAMHGSGGAPTLCRVKLNGGDTIFVQLAGQGVCGIYIENIE